MPYELRLTATQHAKILAFYTDPTNKGRGYKAALEAAGIAYGNTSSTAKQLIEQDPELHDAFLQAQGLDAPSLLRTIGAVASDLQHKDCVKAATWGLNVIHGMRERRAVEMTGADGGPMEVTNPDVAAAVDRFTALTDAAVRRTTSPGTGPASRPAE